MNSSRYSVTLILYFFSSLFLTWWLRRKYFFWQITQTQVQCGLLLLPMHYYCQFGIAIVLLFLQSSWCISQVLSYWFIYWNCAYIRKTFALIYFTAPWKEKDNFVHFYSEFSENVRLCSGDFLLRLSLVRARRLSEYLRKKWDHKWRHFKVVCPYP